MDYTQGLHRKAARQEQSRSPHENGQNVCDPKFSGRHPGDAGCERNDCPQRMEESADQNALACVPLNNGQSPFQQFRVACKRPSVRNKLTIPMSQPKADGIAGDCTSRATDHERQKFSVPLGISAPAAIMTAVDGTKRPRKTNDSPNDNRNTIGPAQLACEATYLTISSTIPNNQLLHAWF